MTGLPLSQDAIETGNARHLEALRDDYDSLGRALERRGTDIHAIKAKVAAFSLALPSWGSGRGSFSRSTEPSSLITAASRIRVGVPSGSTETPA